MDPFRSIALQTRAFALRLFGRESAPLTVALWALLISISAGLVEEFAFRGLLFSLVDTWLGVVGLPVAFLGSAVIFAAVHIPVFGSNASVELLLGLVFSYAYVVSGHNLAVPIAAHALYDFVTLFGTWAVASHDIKAKISQAKRQLDEQHARRAHALEIVEAKDSPTARKSSLAQGVASAVAAAVIAAGAGVGAGVGAGTGSSSSSSASNSLGKGRHMPREMEAVASAVSRSQIICKSLYVTRGPGGYS